MNLTELRTEKSTSMQEKSLMISRQDLINREKTTTSLRRLLIDSKLIFQISSKHTMTLNRQEKTLPKKSSKQLILMFQNSTQRMVHHNSQKMRMPQALLQVQATDLALMAQLMAQDQMAQVEQELVAQVEQELVAQAEVYHLVEDQNEHLLVNGA